MKNSKKELTLEEYRAAVDKHVAKVTQTKEAAIKDLQRAGIVGKDGKLAAPYK